MAKIGYFERKFLQFWPNFENLIKKKMSSNSQLDQKHCFTPKYFLTYLKKLLFEELCSYFFVTICHDLSWQKGSICHIVMTNFSMTKCPCLGGTHKIKTNLMWFNENIAVFLLVNSSNTRWCRTRHCHSLGWIIMC